ncbi:unnamed protein product [Symbiodinium natans]|uniref:Cyclic nucleotide-binding domain-containing protein n=1 Tax=Symbiodinium natans TaxID=878477 RepID=A0A812I996_9DINO|nr:unnamed protein product [Symbiodinium natans]
MLRKPTTVARRLAQCQSRRTQKGTARSTNLESAAPTTAWHVRSPEQLALITTLGNLASLGSAATHDHIMVRLLAGLSSMVSVSYNLLMPKPLKAHQTTAAAWSCVFAVLHFANFALLVRENQHSTELTDEQEDIYEHGFQIHGVTPRQFRLLLNSGARFRDYDAGETIVELGKPVDKVIYITHGSCVGERGAGCVCLEYHQDVFIGQLQPKAWREEYTGTGSEGSSDENESESKESKEDDWLIEKCAARRKRSPKDLRKLLEVGLAERSGPTTKLQAGEDWKSTVKAGRDGCRALIWPIGRFSCTVGSNEALCKAMEHMCTLSLASKICAGAQGKALEGYFELLSLVVRDGIVDPQERHALSRYRSRHAIPDTEHWHMLDQLGWSLEEYDHGFLNSKYDLSWRAWTGSGKAWWSGWWS